MGHSTGIGVLDKAVLVLRRAAEGPVTLADLVEGAELPRATAHRIAVALEEHGLLQRNDSGAWLPGPLLARLAAGAAVDVATRAGPVLERLCRATGESAQLFQREADVRVCTAMAERASGLRDTVPLGARLPMTAGSAAHVLLAWPAEADGAAGADGAASADGAVLEHASFSSRTSAEVRRLGYAHSNAEREAGVASISAPVRDPHGAVIAAVSVSGPVGRLGVGRRPDASLVAAVLDAAASLSEPAGPIRGVMPSAGRRRRVRRTPTMPPGRSGA